MLGLKPKFYIPFHSIHIMVLLSVLLFSTPLLVVGSHNSLPVLTLIDPPTCVLLLIRIAHILPFAEAHNVMFTPQRIEQTIICCLIRLLFLAERS